MTAVRSHWIALCAGGALVLGCVGEGEPDSPDSTAVALSESPELPGELMDQLEHCHHPTQAQLDHVYTLDHFVAVGRDRRVHVVEKFTLRSWLHWPHRAVLMLPGTPTNSSFYDLDVDGYRFQSTLAQEGLFTFAIDYEGSGQSTFPANGLDVTHAFIVDEGRRLVEYVRRVRLVPRVDVLGESNGGAAAAELCADGRRVRSCVMSSMLYHQGTDFFNIVFLDPNFIAFLVNQPNGYLNVTPDLYFNILARATPEVAAAIVATQPGRYSVAAFAEETHLPNFDPTQADVPGLIIQGTQDDIATQADNDDLAAAYGSAPHARGHATVLRIDGAGHIPRVEPAPINDEYTQAVVEFLDVR